MFMDTYIKHLTTAADRGDVAACAALINYHGLMAVSEKLQVMTDAFCVLQDAVHDTDAYYEVPALASSNEELAEVPDEVPEVVFQPDPVGEGTPNPEPVAEAPVKPIRAGSKARTEL